MLDTPLGPLTLEVQDGALVAVRFEAGTPTHDDPHGLTTKLRRYFDGALDALDDVPTNAPGTAFQKQVWAALREIPAGETRSYADIARAIGQPTATRAVGLANGRNPVAIVVPCHRVIGSDGTLTGYAGGLHRKKWLLSHEQRSQTTLF